MAKSFLQRRYLIPQKLIPLGPWRGVRDQGDSGGQSPEYLQDCINGLFVDPRSGGAVVARPGLIRRVDGGSELGTGAGLVQASFALQTTVGNFAEYAFVDGVLYSREVAGIGDWEDVSPSGITISATASVIHVVPFESSAGGTPSIIVNDGVNEPWVGSNMTGNPVTGTEIEYNTAGSAWVARGAPTIHGGKVFFLIESVGGTRFSIRIAWSEELDAATGYAQTGYTNFWDVVQSGPETINQILGTNTGLYLFRRNSIALIQGSVNADFVTATTHADVSQEVGAIHPPLLARNRIWFYNADGLPCCFPLGGRVSEDSEIWRQMSHRIQKIRATSHTATGYCITSPQMAYSPDVGKVAMLFLRDTSGSTTASRNLYIFDGATASYEGRWIFELASQPASETPTAVQIRHLGAHYTGETMVSDESVAQGFSSFFLGGAISGGSTFGCLFRQTLLRQQTYGDNSAAMHFSITPMLNPNDQVTEFRVDEIAIDALPDSGTMSLDYYTPRASTTALSLTGITASDSIQSSYDHGRYVAGLNARGRWFRPVMHWNVTSGSTPYAFERAILKVRGFPASPRAK